MQPRSRSMHTHCLRAQDHAAASHQCTGKLHSVQEDFGLHNCAGSTLTQQIEGTMPAHTPQDRRDNLLFKAIDKGISATELLAFVKNGLEKAPKLNSIQMTREFFTSNRCGSDADFDRYDADNNGILDYDEFTAYGAAIQLEKQLAATEAQPGINSTASTGCTTIVQIFKDAEADVNARSRYGHTPLHHALKHGNENVMALLIDAKADLHAKSDLGRSALQLAEYGAEQNDPRRFGNYPKAAEFLRVRMIAAEWT